MFIEINFTYGNLPKKMKHEWHGSSEETEQKDGGLKALRRIVNTEALEDIALLEETVEVHYKHYETVYCVKMYGAARNDFGSSKYTEYYPTKEEAEQRYNEILNIIFGGNSVVKEEPKNVDKEDVKQSEKPMAKKRGRKKKTEQ